MPDLVKIQRRGSGALSSVNVGSRGELVSRMSQPNRSNHNIESKIICDISSFVTLARLTGVLPRCKIVPFIVALFIPLH